MRTADSWFHEYGESHRNPVNKRIHRFEGASPSFFKDLRFLPIGPAWLAGFVYRRFGWNY